MSVVFTIIWIVCLVLNIVIAKKKGRNVVLWAVLSVFFSWIVLIVNLVKKPQV